MIYLGKDPVGISTIAESGDWRESTKYLSSLVSNGSSSVVYPSNIKLSFAGRTDSTSESFYINGQWGDRGIRTVEVYDIPDFSIGLNNFIKTNYNVDSVIFNNGIEIKSMNQAFYYTYIKHIYGALDVSECNSSWALQAFDYTDLYDVEFVPNTISYTINFSNCQHLTDMSLISIANGLNSNASSQNLTLHQTPKARCSTLMGVIDDDLFYESDSGTVSLTNFITNVKGWTIT